MFIILVESGMQRINLKGEIRNPKSVEGHRVVITGLGIVSSIGVGREAFWKNCLLGTSGIQPIHRFETSSYRSKLGGQLPEIDFKSFIRPSNLRRMDRIGKIMVTAVKLAIDDSGIDLRQEHPDRVGISIGTGLGSSDTVDRFFRALLKEGPVGAQPLLFQTAVPNAITSHCAIEYGIKGVNLTFSHKETSAEMAIAYAYFLLKEGRADVLFAGGGDELSEPLFHVYSMLGALSPGRGKAVEGMRPFDRDRNGMILGEGSGILVLETLKHALKRDARIYAEVGGVGLTGSTGGVLRYDPSGDSIAKAMSSAIEHSERVDYISAAANSTLELDRVEALAIQKVFGERVQEIPVSSLKSMIGEFDASGGIRACGLALSLFHGIIPPTIGINQLDPVIQFQVVRQGALKKEMRSALLNGCSNGGSNISLWVKRFED